MPEQKTKHVPKPFRLTRAIALSLLMLCAVYYLIATAVPALYDHSLGGGKLSGMDSTTRTEMAW